MKTKTRDRTLYWNFVWGCWIFNLSIKTLSSSITTRTGILPEIWINNVEMLVAMSSKSSSTNLPLAEYSGLGRQVNSVPSPDVVFWRLIEILLSFAIFFLCVESFSLFFFSFDLPCELLFWKIFFEVWKIEMRRWEIVSRKEEDLVILLIVDFLLSLVLPPYRPSVPKMNHSIVVFLWSRYVRFLNELKHPKLTQKMPTEYPNTRSFL